MYYIVSKNIVETEKLKIITKSDATGFEPRSVVYKWVTYPNEPIALSCYGLPFNGI